jgi:type-F conjugative transfer system pilin assembly protein TrbC
MTYKRFATILLLVLILAANNRTFAAAGLSGLSPDVIKELSVRSEQQAEQLVTPENRHDKWAGEKAAEFTTIFNSPEFQNRVHEETERLKKEVFKKPIEEYYKDGKSAAMKKDGAKPILSKEERVYVFVSSSMPLQTTRNYAAAIDKASDPNVVMVIRGFINGMDDISSTMLFVSRVLVKDLACGSNESRCPTMKANLEIDPLMFRRYQITEVPAVVYASNVQALNVGGSEGIEGNASVQQYYVIKGDAALDYHLDAINWDLHKSSLQELAEAMRKGFYQ